MKASELFKNKTPLVVNYEDNEDGTHSVKFRIDKNGPFYEFKINSEDMIEVVEDSDVEYEEG